MNNEQKIKALVEDLLKSQKKDIIEKIKSRKCDERKVKTFGEWEAGTYEEKMLVNAVLEDLLKEIEHKESPE